METFDLTSEHDRLALVERVFVYPDEPHQRRHGPVGYTDYESYRDWLRDEFSYRCVFSLLRESWPQTRFHIDHLISQKERPDLICDYDNLILLEGRLNLVKGKRRLPDPCKVALGKHLVVYTTGEQTGCIEARDGSEIGDWIIRVLRLDSEDATQTRRDWIGILRSVAQTDEPRFRKFIGFPKNLPNLQAAKVRNTRGLGCAKVRSSCLMTDICRNGIESQEVRNPMSELPQVEIYTDGGCEPNPGPGGYGAVLLHPKKRAEVSGGFRKTTNNRKEIFAAIAGLELLKQPCKVKIYSDSQYVVKAMMEGWVATWKRKGWWRKKTERPENVDLWQRLDALCQTHQAEFCWVKGHAGNLENERCDQLAMAALRQPNLPVDDSYENKPETDGVCPDMQEGEPCNKCSMPFIKRKGRWKPSRDYYYEFHLICPNCQTPYHVESVKRFVEQTQSLF